jgi:predicted permease
MTFALQVAHVNTRNNHGWEHSAFWIGFAVVVVLVFLLVYLIVRFGLFRSKKAAPSQSPSTTPGSGGRASAHDVAEHPNHPVE